jgi:hypothetical protein
MMKLSIKQEGVPVPPPSVVANTSVEIWRDTTGAVYAYGERRGNDCWMHVPGVASYRFTPEGKEVAASVADGARSDIVLDAYQRRVLPMAVQVRGYEVLHASAVHSPAGIVAFCGVSQAGKSTIAFGLSRRGYRVWCDDVLAFDLSDPLPSAISLPFQLRLRPTAIEMFGRESVAAEPAGDSNLPGSQTASLAAVCVLRRADDQPAPVTVRQLAFSDAFLAVLNHACWFTFQDAQDKRRVIDHYMDLTAAIPVFDVAFRSGLQHLPAVLDQIESALEIAPCAA